MALPCLNNAARLDLCVPRNVCNRPTFEAPSIHNSALIKNNVQSTILLRHSNILSSTDFSIYTPPASRNNEQSNDIVCGKKKCIGACISATSYRKIYVSLAFNCLKCKYLHLIFMCYDGSFINLRLL